MDGLARSVAIAALAGGCSLYSSADSSAPANAPDAASPSRDAGSLAPSEGGPEASAPDADAGSDAGPPTCSPDAPFGAPTIIDNLGASANPSSPSLAPDELTIYFSREVNGKGQLFFAKRPTLSDPFGMPVAMAAVNSANDNGQPGIAPNGLVLFFAEGQGLSPLGIFVATRSAIGTSFSAPKVASPLTAQDGSVYVVPSGQAVYHPSAVANGSDLFRRPLMGSTLGPATRVDTISDVTTTVSGIATTPDDIEIFFGASASGLDGFDIFEAHRAAPNAPFGSIHAVAELNSAHIDYPTWLSVDGCRLYMTSGRTGSTQIYVATRTPR